MEYCNTLTYYFNLLRNPKDILINSCKDLKEEECSLLMGDIGEENRDRCVRDEIESFI